MLEAKRRTQRLQASDRKAVNLMKNLADALESKEFQGAFAKVC